MYRRGSGLDTTLVLVTPSGRVWEHWGYGGRKGYVQISGETLANGGLTLTGGVNVGADGKPYIVTGVYDDRRAVPLHESLAAAAHRLINE
ncbi:hypothetical protein GCM10027535_17140 [Mycolicibacterium hippocampi]|uniref:Uncharacterized protein n=1 Tax=Mycolicibacterium hippocampi TaxID=659824 RepID=A0A7I9ZHU4_9MYCO|nr:hypothetical protein MHIP_10850 [Mycolicibacterium hippocampi]